MAEEEQAPTAVPVETAAVEVVPETPAPTVPETPPEVSHYLVARDPEELARAHGAMREWATAMVAQMTAEAEEHREAYEIAKRNKWSSSRLDRLYKLALNRKLFYEKALAALEEGYLVVPNFQMDTFAIRTDKKRPTGSYKSTSQWTEPSRLVQQPKSLPQGEGEYRNPAPETARVQAGKVLDYRNVEQKQYEHSAIGFWPAIQFPIALAKSAVMSDAAKAAALKVFDELGVAHDKAWGGARPRKGDPMILGRLLNPRSNAPDLTFFIAWAIDLSRI